MTTNVRPGGIFTALLILTGILVAYGSLYPFEVQLRGLEAWEWHRFLIWRPELAWGNVLANLLLFFPIGLFGWLCQPVWSGRLVRWVQLLFWAGLFALLLQVLQLWIPARYPDLEDAALNVVGTVLGAFVAGLFQWRSSTRDGQVRLSLPVIVPVTLIFCWIGARLVPFVPSLSWQAFKNDIKPLWLDPALDPLGIAYAVIGWLVVARLLAACGWRPLWLLLLVPGALFAEALVFGNPLSASHVVGSGIALTGVLLWRPSGSGAAGVLFVALGASVVLLGLRPFETGPPAFHLIPFEGLLLSPPAHAVSIFLEKTFQYGALVWLAWHAISNRWLALALPLVLVTGIELAQVWIVGRMAETTDPLWVVALYLLVRATSESGAPRTGRVGGDARLARAG